MVPGPDQCVLVAAHPQYPSTGAGSFNLRLVQRQLGHSSSKVTEVYANLFQADVERSVERLYRT